MKTTYAVFWIQCEGGEQTWKVGEYSSLETAKEVYAEQLWRHDDDLLSKQSEEIQERPGGRYVYNLELCQLSDSDDDDSAIVTIEMSDNYFIEEWS